MNNTCKNCNYWSYTGYTFGTCDKISESLCIEIVSGFDGGYVNNIETDCDFGCNLFEEKE
jgi:hypothetical protein